MPKAPQSRRTYAALSRACVGLILACSTGTVWGQRSDSANTESPKTQSPSPPEQVTVTAQRLNLIGTAMTASEGVVVNDELALTPAYRPGALLETVPGLTVTAHSGEGKADQYMLRGYNLDHGTDLATYVDGMPINEPTHAHGQGYTDLNFMIPELATNVTYTKGTYYAQEGDFASVGSVHVSYRDTIEDQALATVGTLGFQRVFAAGSTPIAGGNLLGALELQHYDGPWVHPDDQRKANAALRYSAGDATNGLSLTAMFYHDLWSATTDQPVRAISEGLIDRFGSLDPSDGGYAQRTSLSAQYHVAVAGGEFSASGYVISNRLTLWNDFTHFAVDPVNGDQEEQHEDRETLGADADYAREVSIAGVSHDVLIGFHTRVDYNDVLRLPTQDRVLLTPEELAAVDYPASFSEQDHVSLSSVAGYLQDTTRWLPWLRTVFGLREDYMYGSDSGTNYGDAHSALFQPKASLIVTPLATTELYASWGRGFHSDDLRGVNQARIAGIPGAPLIARQTGEEVGARENALPNLSFTLAFYKLDAQSETTYDPDAGQDTAGPASTRYGWELNVTYQASRWLELYGTYSHNHARFDTPFDDGTGHIGTYLPNAPFAAGSFDMYLKGLGAWSGGLEYRYVGAFPLSSDNVVQGHGYGEWDGEIHYALASGWGCGVGLFNILDKKADAAEFWYIDRLPGEPADGVPDVHIHPLEPLSVRFTVAKTFD
ncbi:MAG: TonB-dependent receptor [Steroidobacteraceae bacterium]